MSAKRKCSTHLHRRRDVQLRPAAEDGTESGRGAMAGLLTAWASHCFVGQAGGVDAGELDVVLEALAAAAQVEPESFHQHVDATELSRRLAVTGLRNRAYPARAAAATLLGGAAVRLRRRVPRPAEHAARQCGRGQAGRHRGRPAAAQAGPAPDRRPDRRPVRAERHRRLGVRPTARRDWREHEDTEGRQGRHHRRAGRRGRGSAVPSAKSTSPTRRPPCQRCPS